MKGEEGVWSQHKKPAVPWLRYWRPMEWLGELSKFGFDSSGKVGIQTPATLETNKQTIILLLQNWIQPIVKEKKAVEASSKSHQFLGYGEAGLRGTLQIPIQLVRQGGNGNNVGYPFNKQTNKQSLFFFKIEFNPLSRRRRRVKPTQKASSSLATVLILIQWNDLGNSANLDSICQSK